MAASLFKSGIVHRNNLLWKDTTASYFLCFAEGNWSTSSASEGVVFNSESNQVRFILDQEDISAEWLESSDRDEIVISKKIIPNEDIQFNRIFILKNGRQRSKIKVKWGMFNTFQILDPSNAEFLIDDLIEYNANLYEISDKIEESNVYSLLPININLPYTPVSGEATITDANGYILTACSFDKSCLIEKDTEIKINLKGYSV